MQADAHRSPRKSSSFLSLRRETATRVVNINTNTSPSSYFDFYPKKSKTRRPSTQDSPPTPRVTATNPATYAFPTFEPMEVLSSAYPPLIHNQYTRTRSRTGPSAKSQWDTISSVPQLRFSGSSSTQHTTPPRTPDDYMASNDYLDHFPVLVAAPVAGVETMDALVDGMNGGDMISRISSRSRFGIPGHHPLYQPPLPTPPPGVVLGGAKARPKTSRPSSASEDSSDDGYRSLPNPTSRTRRRVRRPGSGRTASNSTITPQRNSQISGDETTSQSNTLRSNARDLSRPNENRKSVVPSISEIIRNHAPPECQVRSRPSTIRSSSLYSPSTQGHATLHEEVESEPEPLTREEEAELLSRSSIDSVADEVQRTIRSLPKPAPAPPTSAFIRRQSILSDNTSIYSPRSDPGAGSIYSLSAPSSYISNPLDTANYNNMVKPTPSQAVAQYLRSARLTTLLKLTRSPHASQDNPLTVSLSDLGCPTGFPVVVFLGLGCVRHIMGLYDEMADCMGLRLITIDRWGLGRTEPRSRSAKGIMQWASVVEEVLDLLHIDQCSIMAHSAGAPYALSFANKLPSRIRGDICLLAPWVGGSESSGYKWLKYVPNSILKTAQAAEWKIQAWMIGKPPTIAYEGIGYNAPLHIKTTPVQETPSPPRRPSNGNLNVVYPSNGESRRPSIGSSSFSEYDDLGDFEGRFESRSTLGMSHPSSQHGIGETNRLVNKRKPSRGILERLKGSPNLPPQPQQDKPPSSSTKRLKGLKSMSSLKGKAQGIRKPDPPSPQLPPPLHIDVGLGLEDLSWTKTIEVDSTISTAMPQRAGVGSLPRSSGRRSISFGSSKAAASIPSSPSPSTFTASFPQGGSRNHHVALGNALIAASHSESSKGTHNDLLQILNHENHSWGFSYSSYPHKVRVWYGDKDERIAENAVRWMERTMGTERCSVKVVKGADHGLMYRSSAVVDVLEWILSAWRTEERFPQPYAGLR
ncbi:hypothetical protein BYT27DRAFT_7099866 [Phlegmacium glaucopus]|nr:hypothetical protein BYT27DRAFT_7099866 [Phlegmacium glaucopus]